MLLLVSGLAVQAPPHRGDITVAEFCENYRYLEAYYDLSGSKILNDEGKWIEKESGSSGITVYIGEVMYAVAGKQDFVFEVTEDGYMSGTETRRKISSTGEINLCFLWLGYIAA